MVTQSSRTGLSSRQKKSIANTLIKRFPTLSFDSIIKQLEGVESSFKNICYDHKEKKLSCDTEPIILSDRDHTIEFGEFTIKLCLSGGPYILLAVAKDPNSCPENDDISHPHVTNDIICFGALGEVVDKAIADGELLDLLFYSNDLLNSYNDENPYATLREWDGYTLCPACNDEYPADDMCRCWDCDNNICGNCAYICDDCGTTICDSCICSIEDYTICYNCCSECSSCGRRYPLSHLGQHGYCQSCQESMEESDEEEAKQTDSEEPRTGFRPPTNTMGYTSTATTNIIYTTGSATQTTGTTAVS